MRRLIAINLILILIFSYFPVSAASGITLDGNYSDWSDKPYLNDTVGDEYSYNDIVTVRWYPDNTAKRLYFYLERKASNYSNWSSTVYLKGENGVYSADIYYSYNNGNVNVYLYDSSNRLVWSVKGKWGDVKSPGTRLEFYLPLSYLVSSTTAGYQIAVYFSSSYDDAPDLGDITISSVSTGPVVMVSGVVALNIIIIIIIRKKRKVTA